MQNYIVSMTKVHVPVYLLLSFENKYTFISK